MARTRSIKKTQGEAVTAAALSLFPTNPLSNAYDRNIGDYIINQGDGADEVAWNYFRTIPELHYLVTLMGNALSQVRLFVGETDASNPGNPTPVGPRHPALDLLRGFAGGEQGQSELMNRLGTQLTVVGDSVIIGPSPDATLQYPYDDWRVYSTTEVSSRSGRVYVKGPNYREESVPNGGMAIRIWKQNPQEWWRADSPVKSSLSVLRELELLNAHVQATCLSRLKTAGILAVPEEFTIPGAEVEVEGEDTDPFTAILTQVMELAIKNPGSAAALVPIIMRGPAEYINTIKLIDFGTEFDSMITDLRNNAIRRLALGLDAPPEVLLGSAESSSWSMWQISEAQLRLHIRPLANLIADSLTVGWLRPALEGLPLADQTKESIPRVGIYADFSQLQIRPDVGADAQALYDHFEIGGDTFRHIVGLGEGEKPTPKELEYQILLFLIKSNPQMAPWAIKALKEQFEIPFPDAEESMAVGQPAPPPVPPGVGTPPKAASTGTAPKIPGPRSTDKQTATPKAEPADGDSSNNKSNGPSKLK